MKLLKQMMTWAALLVFSVCASAQNPSPRNVAAGRGGRNLPLHGSAEFYQSAEARRIADQVLLYQRVTGGWPKNINMSRPLNDEERAKVLKDKERRDDSTTDNGATSMQMVFLAKVWQTTKDDRYKEAFVKGVDYLLSGQYDNGGWPQFWPEMHGYQVHITYNDDAMVNTMRLLRDVADEREPYKGLADKALRKRCSAAFDKGVECILKTQMRIGDVLTGHYTLERRMMLRVQVIRNGVIYPRGHVLNDAVVSRGTVGRILEVSVSADGTEVGRYRADGVIAATPTGSTAYSLAAGGPVIEPAARNIIITPVCAHALYARSFVLAPGRRVTISAESEAVLTLDGRDGLVVTPGEIVAVTRSPYTTDLIRIKNRSVFDVLHAKL